MKINEIWRRNDLKFWFPKLKASGVVVPRTEIVESKCKLIGLLDNETPAGFGDFVEKIKQACDFVGYPAFLRTGQTSGKHGWKDTCFIENEATIPRHIAELVEFSELCDIIGLPYQTWVVREFLPLEIAFKAFTGEMPINQERRYFFGDGKAICHHPYWPEFALEGHVQNCDEWQSLLEKLNHESPAELTLLSRLTEQVAKDFEGAWSLDWAKLAGKDEWVAIDMAVMESSFHWPGCKYAKDSD